MQNNTSLISKLWVLDLQCHENDYIDIAHHYRLYNSLQILCINTFILFLFQLYNFGETVSIVFWTESWKPQSFYDKIMKNLNAGLHTLCLLGNNDSHSIYITKHQMYQTKHTNTEKQFTCQVSLAIRSLSYSI